MMSRLLWAIAAALCVVTSATPRAQRDTPPSSAVPTGAISGQIVATTPTLRAVGRATVSISASGIERVSISTDDGRFLFDALPPGRYTVRARKAAWLETTYGAIRPGGAGTPIALAAGERRDISVPMARGAVIEGRLTLPNGAPATRTSVRIRSVDTGGVPRGVDPAITDDRGIYRIYGIPSGEYLVQASPPVIPAMMQAMYQPAAQEIDNALERLRGRARSTQPGTSPSTAPPSISAARQIVYSAVFYPGVAARDTATSIALAPGDERLGVDFVFTPATMSRVAGQLVAPVSSFAGAQVRLQQRGSRATLDARVLADGSFVMPAVAPGTYDVTAKLDPARQPPPTNEPRVMRALGSAAADAVSDGTLWGTTEVQVNGQDIEGLAVGLAEGGAVAGRLRLTGPVAGTASSVSGARLRLTPSAQPQSPVVSSAGFTTLREVAVAPDGQFVVAGIAPGAQQLSVVLPAALTAQGWWARSAVADDVDLLDVPLNMAPGTRLTGVDVVLSRQRSSLSGRLQLSDGRPGSDYFVIAFSTDPRAWQALSRRTHAARPADDGGFRIEDLPPGDYVVAVIWDFDAAMLSSTQFFQQAAASGVRVTLADGEQREQSFEVGR